MASYFGSLPASGDSAIVNESLAKIMEMMKNGEGVPSLFLLANILQSLEKVDSWNAAASGVNGRKLTTDEQKTSYRELCSLAQRDRIPNVPSDINAGNTAITCEKVYSDDIQDNGFSGTKNAQAYGTLSDNSEYTINVPACWVSELNLGD